MQQRRDARGDERSEMGGEVDELPGRVVAEAREARTAVLRSFLRLIDHGVQWADDPGPKPDPGRRDPR
jgi:hypothetical protein